MPKQTRAQKRSELLKAKLGGSVKLECPECGSMGPHDTNGDRQEPTMLCEACGNQFDVNTLVLGREA